MNDGRPEGVSDLAELEPPLLRRSPRQYFDSWSDREQEGPQVLRTFKIRGRIRNVIAPLPLPQGALVAARVAGESTFELLLDREIFLCRFSLGGRTRYDSGGQTLGSDTDLMLSPDTRVHAAARNAAVLLVAIKQQTLARALGTETAPSVGMKALGAPHGSHLRAMALAAAQAAERLPDDLRPAFLRNFQNTFARAWASVLMRFAPDLRRPDPMIGRRKVAELREWAALDHAEPLTVGDLAARCGLGLRALQKNFLRHFDTTPQIYLRNLRLDKVRRLLREETATASVTAAALDAGFVHLGRFAAFYRARFGELPSETARQARGCWSS